MSFFRSECLVLDTARDDTKLSRPENDDAVSESHLQLTAEHQEKVIGIAVRVPDELTFRLDHHHIARIKLRDRPRSPVFAHRDELLANIDCVRVHMNFLSGLMAS